MYAVLLELESRGREDSKDATGAALVDFTGFVGQITARHKRCTVSSLRANDSKIGSSKPTPSSSIEQKP
jgi:hypothetical protein